MKFILLATIALSPGCASRSVDPARVSIAVEPISAVCGSSAASIPVTLKVKNASYGVLRVWIDSRRDRQHYISWLSYEVLQGYSDVVEWKHGPGGHGPMPPDTLHIGSGESTQLVAELYGVEPKDYQSEFRIRFNDEKKRSYTSGPFKPCVPQEGSE